MSAVAIVSVAAVCAGYLWLERHQVGRAASARAEVRRKTGALRWVDGQPSATQGESRRLIARLEAAVSAADQTWAYYERLFLRGASGESPFQLRRARVDRAQRRFADATARVEREAAAWLESRGSNGGQAEVAVRRVQQWLSAHPIEPRFSADDLSLDAAIDTLENALANLHHDHETSAHDHPFRGSSRQDVIGEQPAVSSRQPSTRVAAPPP